MYPPYENANVLVDAQIALNEAYMADIKEVKVDKGATKRERQRSLLSESPILLMAARKLLKLRKQNPDIELHGVITLYIGGVSQWDWLATA